MALDEAAVVEERPPPRLLRLEHPGQAGAPGGGGRGVFRRCGVHGGLLTVRARCRLFSRAGRVPVASADPPRPLYWGAAPWPVRPPRPRRPLLRAAPRGRSRA